MFGMLRAREDHDKLASCKTLAFELIVCFSCRLGFELDSHNGQEQWWQSNVSIRSDPIYHPGGGAIEGSWCQKRRWATPDEDMVAPRCRQLCMGVESTGNGDERAKETVGPACPHSRQWLVVVVMIKVADTPKERKAG